MKIYLVLHGETLWNVENRFQGHLDSPVTGRGINQIAALCRDLADKSIVRIVASPLGRAVASAGQIASSLGCPLYLEPAFAERHFGYLEGKRMAELTQKERLEAEEVFSGSTEISPQHGKALRDATCRVMTALSGLSVNHGNICVVSHGHVIQAVIAALMDADLRNFERYSHLNGGYSILECTGKTLTIEKWGISTHLLSR